MVIDVIIELNTIGVFAISR